MAQIKSTSDLIKSNKEGLQTYTENNMVQEIMDILDRERLSPISAKDRSYAKGFIDAGLEYGKLSFEQHDELYQKWGID